MSSDAVDQSGLNHNLQKLAQLLGGLRWIEFELFSLAGGWVPTTVEPQVRVMWATQSLHHGWHSEVWRERMPELRGLNVDELVVPLSDEWAVAIAAVAELESSADRLAAWFGGLVPTLLVEYRRLSEHLDDVATPGPTRWLRHVLLDEHDDLVLGQALAAAHPSSLDVAALLPVTFVVER